MVPSWFKQLETSDGILGPPLGQSLRARAALYAGAGSTALYSLYELLTQRQNVVIQDAFGVGQHLTADFIPGHVGFPRINNAAVSFAAPTYDFVRGPSPGCADVVVVGKFPGELELQTGYLLAGPSGVELRHALFEAEADEFLDNAYITSLIRFAPPHNKIKKSFIKECEWLLWAELAIIKPKLVILLGAEAIKQFYGKSASVTSMRGLLIPYSLTIGEHSHQFITLSTIHPAAVAREPTLRNGLAGDISRARSFLLGIVRKQLTTEYEVLDTLPNVRGYVQRMISEGHSKFAIDCEWHGRNVSSGGELLTLQISHAPGKAVLIPFRRHVRVDRSAVQNIAPVPRHAEFVKFSADLPLNAIHLEATKVNPTPPCLALSATAQEDRVEILNVIEPVFDDVAEKEVVGLLKLLLERPSVGIGGHHFRADWPWLVRLGIDVVEPFLRGFDTMLWHHMRWESSKQDLTTLTLKYTDMDRYDSAVFDFLAQIKPISDAASAGFGFVPESALYPYALRDADATLRIQSCLEEEYARDTSHNKNLLARVQDEQRACVGIAEMEASGIAVDVQRILQLAQVYTDKRSELEAQLKRDILWPDFNFRSVIMSRELLFGEQLSGKRDASGKPIRLRPEGAVCCELMPIKTTSKPAKPWDVIQARGEEFAFSPSTDKESLGILGDKHPAAAALRRLRFVDQVVKLYTALPVVDEDTGEEIDAGLLSFVDDDSRIRTSIFQTTATGRWSSSRPNLQNIPKRREPELHKMFPADKKPYKIRSVFVAPPGKVLVQADYTQAELLTLAVVSGDEKFWKTLTETPLYMTLVRPDGKLYWLHPDYVRGVNVKQGDVVPAGTVLGEFLDADNSWKPIRADSSWTVGSAKWSRDLHAERAIAGFRMAYSAFLHGPPKPFVENGFEDRRVAAKTVNFGIPYGRGGPAIAREVRQEGVSLCDEDAERMIAGFLNEFDRVALFLDKCKWCATNLGYVANALGRLRRFPKTDDRKMVVSNEREASNFPIQSLVAELLNKATWNFWDVRRRLAAVGQMYDYRLLVGVHDAMLLEASISAIKPLLVTDGLVDYCMTKAARIPCPDLNVCDGLYSNVNVDLFANGGFALGTDKGLFLRWDEKPNVEELAAVGVPEEFWPKRKK